jgi:hypothetical protein
MLSDYESIRQQNIAKNDEFLKNIGLAGSKTRTVGSVSSSSTRTRKTTASDTGNKLDTHINDQNPEFVRRSGRLSNLPAVDYKVCTLIINDSTSIIAKYCV